MNSKHLIIASVVITIFALAGFYSFYTVTNPTQNESIQGVATSVSMSPQLTISPVPLMPKKKKLSKPEIKIDTTKSYKATLTTSEGEIIIDLNAKETPITVNNFVYLAREGFYDGTIFHRVIKDFMIQGGDPEGTGAGGPGYRFEDEPFTGEYVPGTIAMANAGPNTNGSQFFIMHGEVPLPPNYVIFGNVESGQMVVDAIATSPTKFNPASGESSAPESPVKVISVKIEEE